MLNAFYLAAAAAAFAVVLMALALDVAARRAIRQRLVSLGMAPLGMSRRLFRRMRVRGLSVFGLVYRVEFEDEDERMRLFAYEPAGWLVREADGVKRWSGGVWRNEDPPFDPAAARDAAAQRRSRRRR